MGGAERNARKKKQQQMAAKSVAAARSSGGDRNKVLIGIVVVVVLAAGVLGAVLLNRPSTSEALTPAPDLKPLSAPVQRQPDATVLVGKDTAKVTVDVYEDFLCPVCGTFEKSTARTAAARGSRRPQDPLPPAATPGPPLRPRGLLPRQRQRPVCAADAGKFPEYHDALYSKQPEEDDPGYTNAQLVQLGTDLGITAPAFDTCVQNDTYKAQLDDLMSKTSANDALKNDGGFGTPTVAHNGAHVDMAANDNWLSDLFK